jgi:hypothetical protein
LNRLAYASGWPGTLRKPGYCSAWNVFVQLGMTDDTYTIENADSLTYRDFLNSFLPYRPHDTVELKLAHYLGLDVNSPEMQKIKWYGYSPARTTLGRLTETRMRGGVQAGYVWRAEDLAQVGDPGAGAAADPREEVGAPGGREGHDRHVPPLCLHQQERYEACESARVCRASCVCSHVRD